MIVLLLVIAAGPLDLFSQGNAAYEAGQYEQAVRLYDSALAVGQSASLYYNRGNAQFKQGRVGRAIADYTRAYVIAPQDRDVRHNLAFARAYRPDKTLVVENPLVRVLTTLLRQVNLWTARLLAGLLFLAATVVLALFFVRRDRFLAWLALGLGVLLLYSVGAWLSWNSEVNPARAVVVAPELTLRSGPGPEYKEIAVVHDGLEALIRERRPGYVLVQIPGGLGGWADTASIEQLVQARPARPRQVGHRPD